jgi:hypothetical protein
VTPRYRPLLEALLGGRVEFVVVGGVAAVLQGAPVVTFDLDVVHRRTEGNVARLLEVLAALGATYRSDPRGLRPTAEGLLGTGHHLLSTALGPLDLLGAIGDGLGFAELVAGALTLDLPGGAVPVLGLARLIEVKEAVGRPKDLAALPVLRATLDEASRRR